MSNIDEKYLGTDRRLPDALCPPGRNLGGGRVTELSKGQVRVQAFYSNKKTPFGKQFNTNILNRWDYRKGKWYTYTYVSSRCNTRKE